MDYTQVLAEIKKGRIQPVYLLHGEEVFLTRKIEKALIDALLPADERDMGLTVLERDPGVAELANLVETVPFMGGKNVVIIRETQLFRPGRKSGGSQTEAGGEERLLKLLADIPEYTCLIFTSADRADKRLKLFKQVEQAGAAVELSALKAKDVRPWVVAKLNELDCKLVPDAFEHLLAAVSMMPQISLGFLDREIEKAALHATEATITLPDLQAVMSSVPEVSVFAMIDALSQKQTGRALQLIEEQFTAGENAIRLLALLARQVRLLWQSRELAERGADGGMIARQLGIPPFVGEKLARQSMRFTMQKLRQTLVALAEADRDLKSGRADKMVLERIIIDMCT